MSMPIYPIKLTLHGIGEIEIELRRTLAPRTISTILNSLPMNTRAIKRNSEFHIPLHGVRVGPEHEKCVFDKGDVGFDPRSSELIVFLSDEPSTLNPFNLIGKVSKGLEFAEKARLSVGVSVEKE